MICARVRPLARPARLLLDRQPRDLRRLDADGDRLLAEHRRDRQEGTRLARPARARARPARRGELAGQQARHRPDRLEAPGRDAVHAHRRRASTTARRTRPRSRAGGIIDPALVPERQPPVVVGLGQRLRLPARRRPQPRPRAPGRAGRHAEADADLQVALGHRVGLRLRLRALEHGQRQDLQVLSVGQGLHDGGDAEPERQRLPAAVRQRAHGLERLLRRPDADRRPAWPGCTRTRRSSTTSTTSPT